MTLQVYPPTEITPRPSQSQGNLYQGSQLQNNFSQSGNGFPDQPSQMETDERSLQSQVISKRGPSNVYIEWIDKSVQEGFIHCYSEGDIKVGRTPIATGAYGVVYKATMKRTGMPVAMKTLVRRPGECEEKLYKKFVKEVVC